MQMLNRVANSVARSLRSIKRTLLPGVDARRIPFAAAYLRVAEKAGRLEYLDDVAGHKMFIDDQDSLRLSVARIHGPGETAYFTREIKPGQTVVDMGANIGYFSLIFARSAGTTGRVYSFEPDPTNQALLRRNIALNNYSNVVPEQLAVWKETTTLELFQSEENRGDHRTWAVDGRKAVEIKAVSLDDYFASITKPVHWIKMDIQGSEYQALQGMRKLLERNRGITLYTEFWPMLLERAGSSANAMVTLLRDLGFEFFQIEEDSTVTPVDMPRLLETLSVASGDFGNLLCRRPPHLR